MEKKTLTFFAIAGIAIAAYGILTMQVLLAAALQVLLVLAALYLHVRTLPEQPAVMDEGWSAIIAAAAVAWLFSTMHAEFLLWAVALAALFLIEQSLARIEKRLNQP